MWYIISEEELPEDVRDDRYTDGPDHLPIENDPAYADIRGGVVNGEMRRGSNFALYTAFGRQTIELPWCQIARIRAILDVMERLALTQPVTPAP